MNYIQSDHSVSKIYYPFTGAATSTGRKYKQKNYIAALITFLLIVIIGMGVALFFVSKGKTYPGKIGFNRTEETNENHSMNIDQLKCHSDKEEWFSFQEVMYYVHKQKVN